MDVATELAWRAGRATLGHFQTGVSVELKDDATPVTAADRESEQIIRRGIEDAFPADGVLGEEFGEEPGSSGRRWVIDPIDGTKSFVQGVPLYGVLVALETETGVVAGAIYLPALDEMLCAATGHGCWWNGRRAHVSDVDKLSDACICYTSSRSFAEQGRSREFDRFGEVARIRRGWGDCYGHVLVATGRAEVMLDPIIGVWDCAPLVPILQEAGGTFTDWRGQVTIHGGDGISTNGAVLAETLGHLS